MKTIHINDTLHKDLKKIAIDKDKNLREYVEEILTDAIRLEYLKIVNEITKDSKLTQTAAEKISDKIKADIWERHK
ncbi:MAG: hypothetical protein ACTSO9_14565 [Candidatus Helarchaeota archaeon]